MGFLSALFGKAINNANASRETNDDYVSKEDYDEVQRRFRGMLDAQESGDDEKYQRIWNSIKNNEKDCDI